MKKEEQKAIIENYISAFNDFDINRMIKDLDSNLSFKNTENGLVTVSTSNLDEFMDISIKTCEFFDNRKVDIIQYDYIDNVVIIYYNFSSVLAQDLNESLKKGQAFNIGGKSIFTFEKGKVVSIEDFS